MDGVEPPSMTPALCPDDDDWTATIEEARAFCVLHVIDWLELRRAVVAFRVAQDPARFARQGVAEGHIEPMIYAVVMGGQLEQCCSGLVQRGALRRAVVEDQRSLREVVTLEEQFSLALPE